jgi:hypothetical protein
MTTDTTPRVRRLACTIEVDELECSADHSRVRVDVFGIARCAYGHTWTGQRDERGRMSRWETAEPR